jgi:hypothetical protein
VKEMEYSFWIKTPAEKTSRPERRILRIYGMDRDFILPPERENIASDHIDGKAIDTALLEAEMNKGKALMELQKRQVI